MAYLVDTSILLRLANTSDIQHAVAQQAVLILHHRGERLHVAPQNMVEFYNAATRPAGDNGLGLITDIAAHKCAVFESLFPLLPETADIYPAWKSLVSAAGVIGKQVHDARLAAVCHVYAITHVLTFNVRHFVRLASFGPGFAVVHPSTIRPEEQ
ncbi:MAG TPA: type II toxin-antitoxin system VapC family toxin [Herpetosiphonaceae bacterium]|nr:type II toxin-antitoxin system VapC family toxin [Herpetosiphonaceae bacterium]